MKRSPVAEGGENESKGHVFEYVVLSLALLIVVIGCFRARSNVVVDNDGSSDVTAMATAVPEGPPLPSLRDLHRSPKSTEYSIDSVRQAAAPELILASEPSEVKIRSNPLILSGWAVDGRRSAKAVFVTLDGRAVTSCPIALQRADVVAALHNPALAISGFVCMVPASAVKPGHHALGLDIATRNGEFYRERSRTTLIVP